MPTDRRFTEEEIAAIFERAAADQRTAEDRPSSDKGLTLAELHKIGAEAGISADFITRAAAAFAHEAHSTEAPETFLGLPRSASYSIEISGEFSDEDWDRLVVDCRQTFKARGEISRDGSLREWRNGNLFAHVEPTVSGARLRLGTRSEGAPISILAGAGWFLFWFLIGLTKFADGGFDITAKIVFLSVMSLIGVGFAGISAFTLPRWQRTRQSQMEAIAARVLESRIDARSAVEVRQEETDAPETQRSDRTSLLEIPDEAEAQTDSKAGDRPDRLRN